MADDHDDLPTREIAETGYTLLADASLNKGTAFSDEERRDLGLLGLLPPHVERIEDQVARAYEEYGEKENDLERHIFLRATQDHNRTLFYRLVQEYLKEMLPIVYTPTVGEACRHFSHIYRRPQGLFVSYPYRDRLDEVLANAPVSAVEVIVVTDGERILGLGDQGVGGMGIPLGKLSLYTACAGIDPATTLPVLLDTGTDNPDLLADPLYMGWRHERIRGEEYDHFVDRFVTAVERKYPQVLLQWEDFSIDNAQRLLARYRDRLCTFNDDVQGTAAVVLGALLAAVKAAGMALEDQCVVVVGAGSAGCGIAEQIVTALRQAGLARDDAYARLLMVDKNGLLHEDMGGELRPFQKPLAQPRARIADWDCEDRAHISLNEVIANAHPSVLVGVSGQAGLFSRDIVQQMAAHAERPIIFPLSNPNANAEAKPRDLIEWTDGRALVATGSPFDDVDYKDKTYAIPQCNNAYIFPGMGLGVLAGGVAHVSDEMFAAAARALSECAPAITGSGNALLPDMSQIFRVSRHIAVAVAEKAREQGHARAASSDEIERGIEEKSWTPRYHRLRRRHD